MNSSDFLPPSLLREMSQHKSGSKNEKEKKKKERKKAEETQGLESKQQNEPESFYSLNSLKRKFPNSHPKASQPKPPVTVTLFLSF